MANTRNTTRNTGVSQNQPQSTAAAQGNPVQDQPAVTAPENIIQRHDRMEDALVNLQQITNQINNSLRRLAEGQMVTPPQQERPRDRPARQPERGIQIREAGNRDQPRTQPERHADRTSKGKGKVADLPHESGTGSLSTDRDREQPSKRATVNRERQSSEQNRQSRSVFERISREPRQNPVDLRQHLEQRRSRERSTSDHHDQSRSRRTIILESSQRSQQTLPNQPAVHRNNDQRPPLPSTNALPPNIDVHNLKIALETIAGWDDELVDGYRQSPFNEEVRAAALPIGFKLPTINTFDGKTDPQDHMDHFSDLMELHQVDDLA